MPLKINRLMILVSRLRLSIMGLYDFFLPVSLPPPIPPVDLQSFMIFPTHTVSSLCSSASNADLLWPHFLSKQVLGSYWGVACDELCVLALMGSSAMMSCLCEQHSHLVFCFWIRWSSAVNLCIFVRQKKTKILLQNKIFGDTWKIQLENRNHIIPWKYKLFWSKYWSKRDSTTVNLKIWVYLLLFSSPAQQTAFIVIFIYISYFWNTFFIYYLVFRCKSYLHHTKL